jgi:hypothetical protein
MEKSMTTFLDTGTSSLKLVGLEGEDVAPARRHAESTRITILGPGKGAYRSFKRVFCLFLLGTGCIRSSSL